ncbi:MAG: NADH-quinone oxidoreductase subunit H [Kiritimatiellae bacterium]|nr:NADH-quinone oxidoreductase subunit H [Kiritimatiellia bacterium]
MNRLASAHLLLALALAPLLGGIVNRVKARFAGRQGPPLLQGYYDLGKLLRKGAVFSRTTTWVFRAGPLTSLAATIVAMTLTPLAANPALLAFPGDLFICIYFLGLARFVTVLAALDTGSAFEGMGASREVLYGALAEPAILLGLVALGRRTQELSLSAMYGHVGPELWHSSGAALALVLIAFFITLLAENARIPFDDPNTHLELTMIHEVMVLDHSGPDLASIEYGAALKLWLCCSLATGLLPCHVPGWAGLTTGVGAIFLMAVMVGVVESCMARVRLLKAPHLLAGATVCALLALLLEAR